MPIPPGTAHRAAQFRHRAIRGGATCIRRAFTLSRRSAPGLGASGLAAAADDAKLKSYGRHLAQECTGCHRIDGIDNGIPSIVGWDTERFVATLRFYKTGARTNPVMVSVAGSLDDEQLSALAAYYGSLPKPPPKGRSRQPRALPLLRRSRGAAAGSGLANMSAVMAAYQPMLSW